MEEVTDVHLSYVAVCKGQYEHRENFFCFVINLMQPKKCAHLHHCPCYLWLRYKFKIEKAAARLDSANVWNVSYLSCSDTFFWNRSSIQTLRVRKWGQMCLSSWIYMLLNLFSVVGCQYYLRNIDLSHNLRFRYRAVCSPLLCCLQCIFARISGLSKPLIAELTTDGRARQS